MKLLLRVKGIGSSLKKVLTKRFRAVISKMSLPARGGGRGSMRGEGGRGSMRGGSGREPMRGVGGGGRPGYIEQSSNLSKGVGAINLGPEAEGGRSVHVVTNHFELRWTGAEKVEGSTQKEFTVHHYHVQFSPEDLRVPLKKLIISKVSEVFRGAYIFDTGSQLFCANKFVDEDLEVSSEQGDEDNKVEYVLKITFVKTLPQEDPVYLQIYNLIVRKCLFGMGLDEMGENFYDAEAIIDYPHIKVQLWPGYITAMQRCEKGLLLCVDVTHKVVRETDLLMIINELKSRYSKMQTPSSLEELIKNEIKGSIVMTPYSKKGYRVEDLRTDLTPVSTFTLKNGEEITFQEYYRSRYNIEVHDMAQPLVTSIVKLKGKGKPKEAMEIVLLPELCKLTGLTDDMRANMGIMKELSKHLHLPPNDRAAVLIKFMERLASSEKCQETLRAWGFEFVTNLAECTLGKVLPSQTITFANGRGFLADDKNDWTKGLRTNQMLVSVPLNKWIMIVAERDLQKAQEFYQTMRKVATPLGFKIDPPMTFERLLDTRVQSYIRSLEKVLTTMDAGVQMILCVLPNNNADLYNAIKRRLSHDHGIVSQCLLAKNLTSKNAMSIATKLVIQMNTKLGGEPWTIPLPVELEKHSAAVGFDYSGKGAKKMGYLVTTTNNSFSRYFSFVFPYKDGQELSAKLNEHFVNCLDAYRSGASNFPQTVVFYRNNVEEGLVNRGDIERDATGLNTALQVWAEKHKLQPIHLVYVVMAKRSTIRLMSHAGNCDPGKGVDPGKVKNPPVGTVVDKEIVAKDAKYPEFFMVTTMARQGTVRAVQYRVVLDTHGLPPPVLQAFTYKMCHLYYNWSGTVNVPSVCQYAAKLAKQTSQTMPNARPNQNISKLLHFL